MDSRLVTRVLTPLLGNSHEKIEIVVQLCLTFKKIDQTKYSIINKLKTNMQYYCLGTQYLYEIDRNCMWYLIFRLCFCH